MNRGNLWLKLAGVALLCLLFGFYVYSKPLKLGIDLDGGYSLLYEIDESGLNQAEKADLAERVIKVLKKRVDPESVRNLVWRPIGTNRLEIQMPRPSDQVMAQREQFDEAFAALEQTNVGVGDLYDIMALQGEAREQALEKVVAYAPQREQIVPELVQAYDALMQARQAGDAAASDAAQARLDAAIDKMLDTNFPIQRLMDALEIGGGHRDRTIAALLKEYPARQPLVEKLSAVYTNWASVKSGLDDPADLRRLLRGAGVLEFRILVEPTEPDVRQYVQQLTERGPRVRAGDQYGWFLVANPADFRGDGRVIEEYAGKSYVLAHLSPQKGLTTGGRYPWKLVRATPRYDMQNAGFAVDFQLDEFGGQLFSELSSQNIGNQLAILLDNEVMSAPVIQSRIGANGQITGRFSMEQAQELAQVLNAGALPARLKEPPLSVRSIGSTLGETNRMMGLRASYIGLAAVVVFMAVYYLLGGLIANLAVMLNLLFLLGVMAAFEATFTLPGVAGLILSVGMAVDANVLIFERIREESERGSALRLAIKNGYDRAFSTIFDASVTTLITTFILYYFGSEEIKGFALTLGLGVAASLFTSIWVTRIFFDLLVKYNVIKSLPMLRFFRRVNIDWWSMRRYFVPVSVVLVVCSLVLFFSRNPQTLYDIEFLGGTSAQIELKEPGSMNDDQVRRMVTDTSGDSAVTWLAGAADVVDATAEGGIQQIGAGLFEVTVPEGSTPDLHARQLGGFLKVVRSPVIDNASIDETGLRTVRVATAAADNVTPDTMKGLVSAAAAHLRQASNKMTAAQVQVIRENEMGVTQDQLFEIVTTETSEYVVREAIVAVSEDRLKVEQPVEGIARVDPQTNVPYFPIVEKDLGRNIGDTSVRPVDVREHMGGVALVMEHLGPAITTQNLERRLKEMRLQPDFETYAWRSFDVIGLNQVGTDEEGNPVYDSMAVVVSDPNLLYDEGRSAWEAQLAQAELELTKAALESERTLRKVVQFAPQIAGQTRQRAFIALGLSLLAIMAYIWLRFGTLRHSVGAVVSLFHDVSIGLGAVAISGFIAYSWLGDALMMADYKINLTIMAALLTLVGYSLNDTIVVFDRIRENRGRLNTISPAILNASINQTLTRTILTTLTTLLVTVTMYVVGGIGIQGFAYVMTIGILLGTYSSIAVASPLLLLATVEGRDSSGKTEARTAEKVEA